LGKEFVDYLRKGQVNNWVILRKGTVDGGCKVMVLLYVWKGGARHFSSFGGYCRDEDTIVGSFKHLFITPNVILLLSIAPMIHHGHHATFTKCLVTPKFK
jgi:hypothetical protein